MKTILGIVAILVVAAAVYLSGAYKHPCSFSSTDSCTGSAPVTVAPAAASRR